LTVAHGYSWLAAARFAKRANLPLHLIVHDDWPAITSVYSWLKPWQRRLFGTVYRQAASRLCVSPFMEDEYRHRYGIAGQVLYPSRGKNCRLFDRAPKSYSRHEGPLVGAYAGNIFSSGYARLIKGLAERLGSSGGQLLLFGPHSRSELNDWQLTRENILPQGLVSSEELVSRLRQEADFLFVPMSFDSDGRDNMRLSFPSKLTDYTATGLPPLIWGPDYCSAVRWAERYGPVAEVVTSQNTLAIDAALTRLMDASHREFLGRAGASIGDELFSHPACVRTLFETLMVNRVAPRRIQRCR
jgi:glycosyltransferase involved in cell wall biosynthesis